MWYVWFKRTWLNILWLYNVLSHDSSLVKKQIHAVFNKSLNLAMVCGPILYMILSLKNKTVLVKVLFFVLFWIFFMHRLSFWGLFRVILIRDLKLYGGGFLFCVFIGFGGIFFPYEVIQHLPDYLLINTWRKAQTYMPMELWRAISSTSTQFALEPILQSRLCCCRVGTLENSSGFSTGYTGYVTA